MKKSVFLIVFILFLFAAGCAEVRLQTIPTPQPTGKLRIFVQPFSGPLPRGEWKVPHDEFAKRQFQLIQKILHNTGMYEVISEKEVKAF